MAECSLATLRGRYRGRWIQSNSRVSPRNIAVRMSKRNDIHKIHLPCQFSLARERENGAFTPFGIHGRGYRMGAAAKCSFLQSLMDSEGIVSPNLLLLSDEALLTISIVFAYLAGLVPSRQAFPHPRNRTTAPSSSDSGRDVKCLSDRTTGFYPSDTWSEVRTKLSEALQSNGQDANLDSTGDELKNDNKNYPLSMLAIHGAPRLRLLLITFQHLEMEVRNVPKSSELIDGARWLQVSTTFIDGLIQPAFMKWIEEEQALENGKVNEKLMTIIDSKLKDDDRILKKFNRLGKSELYMDLLYFLRFGSARSESYCDVKFLAEHGAKILEDLIIFLADVIASIYLELMSVDGDMSSEDVSSSLALCSLSTRELQKLRNKVAINGWLHQYFETVVSMYEDRFELYVLRRKMSKKPLDNRSEKTNWWVLAFGKPSSATLVEDVHISPFSLPVRRTKELRALTGWRYYFSLFLELSDIAMPFFRAAVTKVSAAVSYFWVSMIGRSLGLIFSGIRQSLGWR